jgi:hypothetical protein
MKLIQYLLNITNLGVVFVFLLIVLFAKSI